MDLKEGYFYHIYNRGNGNQRIFFTKENYLFFLKKMEEYVKPYASFVSWCLMPTHFHWIIYIHKEKIEINKDSGSSHTMAIGHSMTKSNPIKEAKNKETLVEKDVGSSHTMTEGHSMTKSSLLEGTENKENVIEKDVDSNHTMAIGHSMTKSNQIKEIKNEETLVEKDVGSSHTMTSRHSMTKGSLTKKRSVNYSIGILLRSYTRSIQIQENITGSLFQQHTQAKSLIDEIEISPAYWNTAFGTQINILENQKSYLANCIEYIHDNPVSSKLVKEAFDWEFSSYLDYIGKRRGKLINYDLLKEEGLLGKDNSGHPSSRGETTKNICIIGIGSNVEADANIKKMLLILKDEVEIIKLSAFLKTAPIGIKDQPEYTNGAVKVETNYSQENFKKQLKIIEDKLGRDRTAPEYGPRTMDLDIVVWNGEIVDEDYHTRDFLKKSVQEIM